MYNIRLAEEKDFAEALGLIKEFQEESLDAYNLFCDEKFALEIMPKFIGSSFVLEADGQIVGVLAGLIVNYPLNNEKIFHEQIWYINAKYRRYGILLYKHLEDYCKTNEIKKIVMISMSNSKADKLEEFYKKLGFKVLETHYIKDLN